MFNFFLFLSSVFLLIPAFVSAAIIDVSITGAGNFSPSTVTITAGDQVRWTSNKADAVQPASNPHPDHTDYTALNMGVIDFGGSAITPVLNNIGTWGYHDHLADAKTGTIIINAAPTSSPTSTPTSTPVGPSGGGKEVDITPPVIEDLVFFGDTQNIGRAKISWKTNERASTRVEYGTSSDYGLKTDLDIIGRFNHSVELTGLATGTIYHFRVFSFDTHNNLATSTDKTFKTLNEPEKPPIILAPEGDPILTPPAPPIAPSSPQFLPGRNRAEKIINIQLQLLEIMKKALEVLEKLLNSTAS